MWKGYYYADWVEKTLVGGIVKMGKVVLCSKKRRKCGRSEREDRSCFAEAHLKLYLQCSPQFLNAAYLDEPTADTHAIVL